MAKKNSQLIFINKFNFLLKERNITTFELSKELPEYSFTEILQWSTGEVFPTEDEVQHIADFFGVEKNYLLSDKSKTTNKIAKKSSESTTRRNFATNLSRLTKEKNKKASEIAKDLEVTYSCFSQWCSCVALPNTKALKKIADYFDVTVAELIEERVDFTPKQNKTYVQLKKILDKIPEECRSAAYDALDAYVKTLK